MQTLQVGLAHLIDSQEVQAPPADDVQVNVHAAVVLQHHVADGICPLDVEGVGLEGLQEVGVVLCHKLFGLSVCP